MKTLILENFRCFRKRQEIPLKPLTLLVGENSTGKSSLLAAIRLAHDITIGSPRLDFNEEPFELGTFDQIASLSGGKRKQAKTFTIGCTYPFQMRSDSPEVTTQVIFCRSKGNTQPDILEIKLAIDPITISVQFAPIQDISKKEPEDFKLSIITPTLEYYEPISDVYLGGPPLPILYFLDFMLNRACHSYIPRKDEPLPAMGELEEIRSLISLLIQHLHSIKERPFAFAPIRSKPERTYDPLDEIPRSEGSHTPAVLARLERSGSTEGKKLISDVIKFGKACGLFKSIEVKTLGKRDSDPFQLLIEIANYSRNLVDVGYGVSQVLPILVDVLRGTKNQTYLLQQPEVHLHPRAQAELGSLLGKIAKRDKKRFIIETHGDYLIDRIRMDLRDKKRGFLSADDVIILYFERKRGEIVIHPISLDKRGNIINAPPGYRRFFLDEERRFLEG